MSSKAHEPSDEIVLAERRGYVLLLTLNRPDRLNAWTEPMGERYDDLLRAASVDPEVRAVVLTGAGRGFCAGADLNALEEAGRGSPPLREGRPPRYFPMAFPKPIVAAINGPVAGVGLVEALYCDVRFAVPDAKITTAFARRGLIAEYGISWLLPRLVGTGHALDLLLSGRVIDGREALSMGLVNRVIESTDLLNESIAYADGLATLSSPTSMATIKRQVMRDLDATFEDAAREADVLMEESLTGPDLSEGVASHLQRRAPAFPPLPSSGSVDGSSAA